MEYRIRVRRLNQIFRHGSELDARIARLTVLYEDLRLENLAASEDSIPKLDESGVDEIIAEPVSETGLGVAIMDKLKRANVR